VTGRVVEWWTVKKKKAENPVVLPEDKPLEVDEKEFTDVMRSLVNSPPLPLKRMKPRKNPETDPRYLPVFDLTPTIRNVPPKKKKKH
jgi:hypothetical protein